MTSVVPPGRSGTDPLDVVRRRPPPLPPAVVPRPRLIDRLVDGDAPVTLLLAPAGAGKTTLLSSFARLPRVAPQLAWVSLTADDDDPTPLWRSILAALSDVPTLAGQHALHRLDPPDREVGPGFLAAVGEQLAGIPPPIWLVLDDLQVLRADASLASLALLVEARPRPLRLLLASRSEPPLAALRDSTTVSVLRAAELALSATETGAVLEGHHLEVDAATAARLHRRTEGWAAGVRLAALGLQQNRDAPTFVARFDGDDPLLRPFLADEVLGELAPTTRAALMRLSPATQLTPALARTLSGDPMINEPMRELQQIGLAEIHGDEGDEQAIRLHGLLRSAMAATFRREDPDGWRTAQRTLATFWGARHRPVTALRHAVLSDDRELTATLLTAHGIGLVLDRRTASLRRILDDLPPAWAGQPIVALLTAAVALADDRRMQARHAMQLAQTAGAHDDPCLQQLATILRVRLARADIADDGDTHTAHQELAAAAAALEQIPDSDGCGQDATMLLLQTRAVARGRAGQLTASSADLGRVVELALHTGRAAVAVDALSHLAAIASVAGTFAEQRHHAEHALALAEPRGWGQTPMVTHARLALGTQALLRLDLDAADTHARHAAASLRRDTQPDVVLTTRLLEAAVALMDPARAHAALGRVEQAWTAPGARGNHPLILATFGPIELAVCLRLGERAQAQRAADRIIAALPGSGDAEVAASLLRLAAGRPDRAEQSLEPVLASERGCLGRANHITALVLAADIAQLRHDGDRARRLLGQALSHAAPDKLRLPFLDADDELLALAAPATNDEASLLTSLQQGRLPLVGLPVGSRLLTEAELVLLRELPSISTVKDIATVRGVSVNTVKTQLRSLYRKLDVAGRREAIEVARTRGLL